DGFFTDTVPIYYGSSNISDIFNPKAFINLNDYPDFDCAIDRIMEIDSNDELYLEMLRQPIFNNPKYPQELMDNLEKYLCHIFDQDPKDAFRRARIYSPQKHEEFMQRSIARAEKMDIEGIIYAPSSGKTDKEIAKNYIKNIPKRALKKILGKKIYSKLKNRSKRG
ncbi:MAG: glycosyltransferase family 10, partial [Eubacteriales bacterium]|nr:glycosyltransferase family 10 [Eubacteriales bacterium]